MSKFWQFIAAISVALCGLLGSGLTKPEPSIALPATHAEIAGTVIDSAGKPLQGTAVRILYAWTRVGNVPHCASCWADCGKTAVGDSSGRFAIKSLDPQLTFRVLFVAKDHEPKMVDIDPQKHKLLKVTLKSRPPVPKDSRQIFSGQVVDARGRPIAGALIEPFDYRRSDRKNVRWVEMKGSDPLAVADETGRFTIVTNHPVDEVDVKVTARALADKNFALAPAPKTDARLAMAEGATVRGRVLDHSRPVAGMTVVLEKPGRVFERNLVGPFHYGPFAIDTDSHGEFLFANVPPNQDFNVYGSSDIDRGQGGTPAKQIHVGADGSEMKVGDLMVEGVTIRGRVVDHGQPVAGVKIGLDQEDSQIEPRVPQCDVVTNQHGEFLFAGVPPERDYYVFGTQQSLHGRGCTRLQKIRAGSDGADNSVGDLAIEPGYRVSGRVVLSDGKPIPRHAQINFDRGPVGDSQTIEIDKNGNFTAHAIPLGLVQVRTQIAGYQMSDKNLSCAPNEMFLMGLVEKDIDGLTVLLEPGERKWVDPESNTQDDWRRISAVQQRIRVSPLAGAIAVAGGYGDPKDYAVERPSHESKPLPKIELPPPLPKPVSADANVAKRTIVGRVVDPSDKPVAGADVRYSLLWGGEPDDFNVHTKSGADGRFKLEFPIEWLPKEAVEIRVVTNVHAEAPGYAIGFADARSQIFPSSEGRKNNKVEPLEIRLRPSETADFTVLTPDGKPVVGARVQAAASNSETTDKDGRVRVSGIPPRDDGYFARVEAAGYGNQEFVVNRKSAHKATLQLVRTGRIEGQVVAAQPELYRGMHIEITTFQPLVRRNRKANHQKNTDDDDKPEARGEADLYVGDNGRFVIPAIAAGEIMNMRAVMADPRLPVRPRVIERNDLEIVAGRTTRIEIPMEKTVTVHGQIRIKATGKPFAGVPIIVDGGYFSWKDVICTDANGRYTARVLPGYVNVIIYKPHWNRVRQSDDSGRQRHTVPDDVTDFEMPVVEVEKCKDVDGLLLAKDGKPAPVSSVYAVAGNNVYPSVAWEQGKFVIHDVPEGTAIDRFEVGTTGPDAHSVQFVVQSKDPLVLRLK